jgi:16S rRNA C1402 (ribose-2'-O) methylase RsmI
VKKSKVPSGRWIVRCDGLKVALCEDKREAQKMADALQVKTPTGMSMQFSIEPEPAPAN